jgi:Tfp pilus assembly protein PilV
MKKFLYKNYKTKKGFTLVEALVAISIFSVSILGLMSVLASSISDTSYAKQKVTASYLAQEGIEYLRNMRDTAVLYNGTDAQTGWDAFRASAVGACGTAGCYIADNRTLLACGVSCSSPLLYDSTSGKYNYTSGNNSGFTRKVIVTPVTVGGVVNDLKVSSTVSWAQGSGAYNITFSEDLFNWAE